MKVIVLGCGHACGTPLIGELWMNCNPHNPRNRRTRPSIILQHHHKNILIDSSPDLRHQLLREGITSIHSTLYTHSHSDHAHGINDLGIISRIEQRLIPVFMDRETFAALNQSFGHAFHNDIPHYAPFLEKHIIKPQEEFSSGGLTFLPFEQDHGYGISLGFRVGDFAYSTDAKTLPEEAFQALKGVKTWIVDCLSEQPHPTHSHLEQTLEWIQRVKPERAILTHLGPVLDYDALLAKLPKGVEPAYDGMQIDIPV
ncbi:MAG: MBL fold metallo-hydrolase [Alphaproteobacteria bacterium]